MSKLSFVKFQGAGNDFIVIDDRALFFDPKIVPKLCHRKFGIGADGVLLLQNDLKADFRMRIYNADGNEAEGCGNGLRCLMKFLLELGLPKKAYRIGVGPRIVEADFVGEKVSLNLGAPLNFRRFAILGYEVHSLDTGVPHAVVFSDEKLEVLGPLLQSHPKFMPAKTNVNVAQARQDRIDVRTFERGVGETLACGTGAAAVGYVAAKELGWKNPIRICMPGGVLEVVCNGEQITLIGDSVLVFKGEY
ncbi:MAG: diaminopimelate epimerase [Parachlamydiales bacterium]|nr:diaminopimelate epimerase [Parachlamydiales bacterium]